MAQPDSYYLRSIELACLPNWGEGLDHDHLVRCAKAAHDRISQLLRTNANLMLAVDRLNIELTEARRQQAETPGQMSLLDAQ